MTSQLFIAIERHNRYFVSSTLTVLRKPAFKFCDGLQCKCLKAAFWTSAAVFVSMHMESPKKNARSTRPSDTALFFFLSVRLYLSEQNRLWTPNDITKSYLTHEHWTLLINLTKSSISLPFCLHGMRPVVWTVPYSSWFTHHATENGKTINQKSPPIQQLTPFGSRHLPTKEKTKTYPSHECLGYQIKIRPINYVNELEMAYVNTIRDHVALISWLSRIFRQVYVTQLNSTPL